MIVDDILYPNSTAREYYINSSEIIHKVDEALEKSNCSIEEKSANIDKALDDELHYVKRIRSFNNKNMLILRTTIINIILIAFANSIAYFIIHLIAKDFSISSTIGCFIGQFVVYEISDLKKINGECESIQIDEEKLKNYVKTLLNAIKEYNEECNICITELNRIKKELEEKLESSNLLTDHDIHESDEALRYINMKIEDKTLRRDNKIEKVNLILKKNNISF